ncbi:MAG: protein kinase [Elainellaceae cyanobacterium]
MSLCINPRCSQPNHPGNQTQQLCQCCGASLILQGRYRVMRLLSDRSGFGYVYEAYEHNIPKILKVLKETHNDNLKAVELFEQEARVLSQLKHPGIPFIDQSGCFQFRPTPNSPPMHCIVMEKIDGLNLREWMRQQGNHPINADLALDWLTQLAEILHLVHQHNYFHRDIKPENIMLRASGELVLVDFGAAREMTYTYFARLEEAEGITRVSSTGYTPPEQERGRAVPQSDFYALGCTFMFLLTGQRPMDPTIYDALANQFHWRRYAPHVSEAFAGLIDDLTAARAIDRPSDTHVLMQRLANLEAIDAVALRAVAKGAVAPEALSPNASRTAATQADFSFTEPPPDASPLDLHESEHWYRHQNKYQKNKYQNEQQSGLDAVPHGASCRADESVSREVSGLLSKHQKTALKPSERRLRGLLLALGVAGLCAAGLFARRWSQPVAPLQSQTEALYAEVMTLSGHSAKVNDLALSLDQTLLASGSDDRTVKVWNLEQGRAVQSIPTQGDRIQAVTFSPDGKWLISGDGDGDISIWDVSTGEQIESLVGHRGGVNDLKVTSDGRILGSAGADSTVRLWDLDTGEPIEVLKAHDSYVNAIAFTPDGKTLISGAADRTVRVWDLSTKKATALSHHKAYINDVSISPDGSTLASAGADGDIALWNLLEQAPMGRLSGHLSYVNALAFTADGKTLISSSADHTLKVWNLPLQELEYSIDWQGTLIDTLVVRFGNPYWQVMAGGKGSTAIKVWRIE